MLSFVLSAGPSQASVESCEGLVEFFLRQIERREHADLHGLRARRRKEHARIEAACGRGLADGLDEGARRSPNRFSFAERRQRGCIESFRVLDGVMIDGSHADHLEGEGGSIRPLGNRWMPRND
jgi:hypothetical protein